MEREIACAGFRELTLEEIGAVGGGFKTDGIDYSRVRVEDQRSRCYPGAGTWLGWFNYPVNKV